MLFLPSWSVSPNAYCAPLDENKMRASASVIHPRSSGSNAFEEALAEYGAERGRAAMEKTAIDQPTVFFATCARLIGPRSS